MFKDLDAAYAAFTDYTSDAMWNAIAGLMLPVSVLVPAPDGAPETLTYVGGAPTMSADIDWPVPPMPDDIEEFASRGGETHGSDIRKALEVRLPYSFIAQIDLAEVSEPDLPDTGRLLFFYDEAVGPWDNSQRSAKVIWDRGPVDGLKAFEPDARLLKAEEERNEEARNYVYEPPKISEEALQSMRDAGISEASINEIVNFEPGPHEHKDQRVYFGLKRQMRVSQQLQVPLRYNPEWGAFEAAVEANIAQPMEDYELQDLIETVATYENRVPFQLLGLPWPEQDDPRGYAAVSLVTGKRFPSHEEMDARKTEIDIETEKLRLLFEVSIAGWLQEECTEGTIYFIIRDSDLKARNFDGVIAVYQQT